MNKIKILIDLTRLNKPIGYMLLFWPCLWGLTLAYNKTKNIEQFINYVLLFFLGSVLMRSAGCIFNDIADKNFDKKVSRTKKRPIASKKISINESFLYIIVLCLFANEAIRSFVPTPSTLDTNTGFLYSLKSKLKHPPKPPTSDNVYLLYVSFIIQLFE